MFRQKLRQRRKDNGVPSTAQGINTSINRKRIVPARSIRRFTELDPATALFIALDQNLHRILFQLHYLGFGGQTKWDIPVLVEIKYCKETP